MNNIRQGTPVAKIQMDRLLESAVILSWNDLLHKSGKGLIHIEHAPGFPLAYLKVWRLSGKGEWDLVCEYWMSGGPAGHRIQGMAFSNDYQSAALAGMLEVIMQHQDNFSASLMSAGAGAGMIQVSLPTQQESVAADACMKQAWDSLGLAFANVPAGQGRNSTAFAP